MLKMTVRQIVQESGGHVICGDLEKYGDRVISGIGFDSRKMDGSQAFAPIVGERVDAHGFIGKVLSEACCVSFSEKDETGYNGDKIIIRVDGTLDAVHKLAAACRKDIHVPVIGVTGSVGKTTTRRMIAQALSAGKKVYETAGNANSQIGVPGTIFGFDETSDIAVLEMGMSMPGEMEKLAETVRPEAAVFTNIGITHIENLGSRENILKEKMHITDYIPDGGPVFINNDNELLQNAAFRKGIRVLRYSLNPGTDVFAENITRENGCPVFTADVFGRKVRVALKVFGNHYIMNALAALGVCSVYGVGLKEAADRLSEYAGYAHRQQVLCVNGITVIDDSYNAAPDSMKAALDVLSDCSCGGRKIAVLADMKELGEMSESAHREVGSYAQEKGLDEIITYGPLARMICDRKHFSDRERLKQYILDTAQPGDAVLFKGSNSMKLWEIITDMQTS